MVAPDVFRRRLDFGAALALGAAFGLIVYSVNFYPMTAILFPWFAMPRNWISISSHDVSGVVLVWAYLTLAKRKRGATAS